MPTPYIQGKKSFDLFSSFLDDFTKRKEHTIPKEIYNRRFLMKPITGVSFASSLVLLGVNSYIGFNIDNVAAFGNDLINLNHSFKDEELGKYIINSVLMATALMSGVARYSISQEERLDRRNFQNKLVKDFNLPLNIPDSYNNSSEENLAIGIAANEFFSKMFQKQDINIEKYTKKSILELSKRKWLSKLPNLLKKAFLTKNILKNKNIINEKSVASAIYNSFNSYFDNNTELKENKCLDKLINSIYNSNRKGKLNKKEIALKEINDINEKALINASHTILKQNIQMNYIISLKKFSILYNKESDQNGIVHKPSKELKFLNKHLKQFSKLSEMTKVKHNGNWSDLFSLEENSFFINPFEDKNEKLKSFIDKRFLKKIIKLSNENLNTTIKRINSNFVNKKGNIQVILFKDAYQYQFDSIVKNKNISGDNFRNFTDDYKTKEEQNRNSKPSKRIFTTTFDIDKDLLKELNNNQERQFDTKPLTNYNFKRKPYL